MTGQSKIRYTLFSFILLAAAVLAWGGVVFLQRAFSPNASAREIAKIRARGEPTTMAELAVDRIPDEENAAVVYEQAFILMSSKKTEKDFEKLAEFIRLDEETIDAEFLREVQDIVQHHQDAVELTEKAQERPKCRFKVDWNKGAFDVSFEHYSKVRELTRLLCADALLNAKSGDMEKAVDALIMSLKLNMAMASESSTIGYIVRISTLNTITDTIQLMADTSSVSEKQVIKLYNETTGIDLNKSLVKALQGERAMGIWIYDDVRKNGPRSTLAQSSGGSSSAFFSKGDFDDPLFMKRLDLDEMFFLKQMDDAIKNGELPYRSISSTSLKDMEIPDAYVISKLALPNPSRMYVTRDSCLARLELAKARFALTGYKARAGTYPATLGELKKTTKWELPEDPFSGKEVLYKPKGNGYIIYSIGPDLKDDGGTQASGLIDTNTQGDIVREINQ